ncbi:hypothetical protein ASPWEDRAFT_722856 [Aspergillus wentii DTO 134E9]|uniref:Rhodopsin domain-containing protein n=1 Tax=Aspergillus wentii DTO 134E9 TaxID=1073089 RepID=A0A1L9R6W5_ASPWE|nr:uncharacterized protein ASPWEDRAFT_722856 [Aspergillus wentii DTO 134E9]KAI9926674.1 hypothetical protein MW887_003767 [Aspergillus wentii]OJJ30665.1 hypothetical protein ASPWEDRAFT_722856 [Aspergillus wentii DTO 134E9]
MPLFSHYGDLPDNSSALSSPALVFAIITPIVVFARLLSRQFLSGHIGADDWTILASCVFAETVSIQMIIVCEWAFGKHASDLSNNDLMIKTLKLYFVAQILYKINIGLTKISILLLYIRLFIRRWFVITCWTWVGIVVAFTVGTVFSSIFQCTPVQYAFNKSIPGAGTCLNLTAFWYANAAFNILSDFVIIALPVPIISKLQLPLKSKIALCGLFAVGIFVCITSILRITTLNIATTHLDTTWNSIGSSMWTVIESNLGIICACLPALRRPLGLLFPRLFGKIHRSSYAAQKSEPRSRETVSKRRESKMVGGWNVLEEFSLSDTVYHADSERPEDGEEVKIVDLSDEGRGAIRKTTQVVVQFDAVGREVGVDDGGIEERNDDSIR